MQLLFQNCGASFCVFQRRFKMEVRANFCALQSCTFPARRLTSFLNVLLPATVLRQMCFKIVAQVAVFFNGVSKGQCVQILCPALCTFPTRVFTSFWTCLLSAIVLRQTFFQTCGASFCVFSTAFQKGSACKFLCPAKLHFSCKTARKFLNVLAFSNRITTNVVAKFVTCCQK